MNKKLTIVSVIVALIVGIVIGASFGGSSTKLGGLVQTNPTQFAGGLTAGAGNQFSVATNGAVSLTGDLTVSGTTVLATTTSSYDNLAVTSDITVGATGSAISKAIFGSCNLTVTTVATGSVGAATCSVTGAEVGDTVLVSLASTTPAFWFAVGASANTNQLIVTLFNSGSNSTTTVPTTVKNGAQYLILK